MKAIYKKEVKSYLTSMIGYVFIFFILLLEGIYFTAYNLQNAYPLFGTTLSAVTFIFLILVPVLTMKTIAEERKQKTDQLLLTAPVSVSEIVLGKFLAVATVYAIPENMVPYLMRWHIRQCSGLPFLDLPRSQSESSGPPLQKIRSLQQS